MCLLTWQWHLLPAACLHGLHSIYMQCFVSLLVVRLLFACVAAGLCWCQRRPCLLCVCGFCLRLRGPASVEMPQVVLRFEFDWHLQSLPALAVCIGIHVCEARRHRWLLAWQSRFWLACVHGEHGVGLLTPALVLPGGCLQTAT